MVQKKLSTFSIIPSRLVFRDSCNTCNVKRRGHGDSINWREQKRMDGTGKAATRYTRDAKQSCIHDCKLINPRMHYYRKHNTGPSNVILIKFSIRNSPSGKST